MGGFYAPDQRTPFWLHANQSGIVPAQMPFGTFRVGLRNEDNYRPLLNVAKRTRSRRSAFFALGYGVEAVVNVGPTRQVLLPEAYLKTRIGAFEIWGGRRREVIGLADSTLVVGPYSWSGNALPLSKVQIGLPDYIAVPLTGGLLSVQGFFAHGWFNNGFVKNSFLHQKTMYARLGRKEWPVLLYGGINHQVQWGGEEPEVLSTVYIRNGRFPSGMGDYIDVVTAKSLGTRLVVDSTRYSPFDRQNRIGNHLGTVDLGMEIRGREFSLLLYRQSIYDDGSLYYMTNIADGLNGIRFTNRRRLRSVISLQRVLLEMLYTENQGGEVFSASSQLWGWDNYFNHGQYRDGWSYLGRTIGTPFITPWNTTRSNMPSNWFTNNNRVMVFHTALHVLIKSRYNLFLKGSVCENRGIYDVPFSQPVWQLSSYMALQLPITKKGCQLNISAALDRGDLYTNQMGMYVGVRKSWVRSRKTVTPSPYINLHDSLSAGSKSYHKVICLLISRQCLLRSGL